MKYEPTIYLKNINRKYKLITHGENLIKNKEYISARDYYLKLLDHELFVNDYYLYFKLSQIYYRLDDLNNQKSIVKQFFKSNIYCGGKKLNYFKNIADDDELVKNYEKQSVLNKDLSYLPVLSADEIEKINFTQLPHDYKLNKDFIKFNEDVSVEDKIKFKYKLIKRGDDLLNNKNYLAAIDYFTKLINHPLFDNDSYPYLSLSLIFKQLKQSYDESMIILEFFKTGFYFSDDLYNYFKSRLSKRDCPNIIKKGSENVPLPQADLIKNYYQNLKSDEKTIVEVLINEIPEECLIQYIDYDDDIKQDFKEDFDVVKFTSLNQIDLEERILMINIVNVIKTGLSRSEAAKIVGCDVRNLYKWFNDGKENKNVNTFYFHSQIVKIDLIFMDNLNNSDKYKSVNSQVYHPEIPKDYVLYDTEVDDETLKILDKFEDFLKSAKFDYTIQQYSLSADDAEIVKNRFLDGILQKEIIDDFPDSLNEICNIIVNEEFVLSDDEFDSYFNDVDTFNYTEDVIYGAKIKTIIDYNNHEINKNFIKSRYKYYLKKIFIEKTQISRLKDIENNPNIPQNKRYLSKKQLNDIYNKTEQIILSKYCFSGNVLDYIKYLVEIDINKNKKEAINKFESIINKDELKDIFNFNEKIQDDFKKQVTSLINRNHITWKEISDEFIINLAKNFLPSRRVMI